MKKKPADTPSATLTCKYFLNTYRTKVVLFTELYRLIAKIGPRASRLARRV